MHIVVTTPLFYINSYIHIGHEYSLFYASYTSYILNLLGYKSNIMTGTDENGTKADDKNKIALRSKIFTVCMDMCTDNKFSFYSTGTIGHYTNVRKIYQKFKPLIVKSNFQGKYIDEQFVDNKEGKEEEILRLDLSKHWNCTNITTQYFKEEVDFLVKNTHKYINISRQNSKGILISDLYGTVYVWVDALLSYYINSPNMKIVHIIGKDILRFHSVYLGSMLNILNLPNPHVIVHGWIITPEGDKISKSKNNDPNIEISLDVKKYFFLSTMGPEDIVLTRELISTYHKRFYKRYCNIISRCLGLIKQDFQIRVQNIKIPPYISGKKQAKYFNISCELIAENILKDPLKSLQSILNLFYSYRYIFTEIGFCIECNINVDMEISKLGVYNIKQHILSKL